MPGAEIAADVNGGSITVQRRARGKALTVGLAATAFVTFGCGAVQAHHRTDPATVTANGLAIPALTHGEMAVMASHAAAIRALADKQARTDPTFRRLANFAALQRTYCLWGLMPGSLADEASPFNECLHSYLAALRALLVHMQGMPDGGERTRILAGRIDAEMVAEAAASKLCQNSTDTFNTAEIIVPDWRDMMRHRPTILTLAGVLVVAAAGVWAATGRNRAAPGPSA
jgi:hypothetical protein